MQTTQISRERLIRINDHMWRMTSTTGRALGNISVLTNTEIPMFCAKRFHIASGTYIHLGTFENIEDAKSCIRWN